MFFLKKRKNEDINFGVMQTPLIGYYFPETEEPYYVRVKIVAEEKGRSWIIISPHLNEVRFWHRHNPALIGKDFLISTDDLFFEEQNAIEEAHRREQSAHYYRAKVLLSEINKLSEKNRVFVKSRGQKMTNITDFLIMVLTLGFVAKGLLLIGFVLFGGGAY